MTILHLLTPVPGIALSFLVTPQKDQCEKYLLTEWPWGCGKPESGVWTVGFENQFCHQPQTKWHRGWIAPDSRAFSDGKIEKWLIGAQWMCLVMSSCPCFMHMEQKVCWGRSGLPSINCTIRTTWKALHAKSSLRPRGWIIPQPAGGRAGTWARPSHRETQALAPKPMGGARTAGTPVSHMVDVTLGCWSLLGFLPATPTCHRGVSVS